jgi:aryl-alcohol dehydrogenase-like predicted oxidoreductase
MTFGEADEKSFMHGVGCDEETAFAIMDAALGAGINFLDTADVYGQDGLSERVVGNWFAARKNRERVVLATKFRFRMQDGPNGTGAARGRILRCAEESLRRLRTDYIDLYQIHMQDRTVPEEETLRALSDLVRQGKVLYIGASNYAAYRLEHSQWLSKTQHLEHFVTLQAQYSLIVRELEREHIPVCRDWGIGLLPWSPLARGFLSGKYQQGQEPPEGSRLAKWRERFNGMDKPRNWKIIAEVMAVASELQTTPTAVSLAWLLQKPTVTSVIFGARSVQQLQESLVATEIKLSAEQMTRLDAASAFELGYPYDFMTTIQDSW